MPGDLQLWFSHERMAPYMAACAHDLDHAERLYCWNMRLSAACWTTFGHIEVLLRNALNTELEAWSAKTYGDPHWYRLAAHKLHPNGRTDIASAIHRATRDGRSETSGRVVAELGLGFWRYLLSSRYDGTFWRWCLYRAFPGFRGRRRVLESHVAELHRLRNRVAHLEPLHHLPVAEIHAHAMTVAGWISPDAQSWIAADDPVPNALRQRPSVPELS